MVAKAENKGGAVSTLPEDVKLPETPEEFARAMAEAGAPGPEHAKLKPLAGNWTYTCKFWLDPRKPPLESTGNAERKWILGGRFLEERIQGTGFGGKDNFEGRGLLGYENGRKHYTSNFLCNMDTGICNGLGDCDASGRRFTFHTEAYCPMMKKVVKGRDEIRIESDDRVVLESFLIEKGEEIKTMELVSLRRKET